MIQMSRHLGTVVGQEKGFDESSYSTKETILFYQAKITSIILNQFCFEIYQNSITLFFQVYAPLNRVSSVI